MEESMSNLIQAVLKQLQQEGTQKKGLKNIPEPIHFSCLMPIKSDKMITVKNSVRHS